MVNVVELTVLCIVKHPTADTANLADTVVQGNQDQKPSTGLTRHYVCSTCGVTLQVSTADILRHRKTCQPVETDISVKSDDNCQV